MERQKLVRKIRKIITQLSEDEITEKSKKKLQKEKDKLMDDLCYVMYFPKNQKYIALFAQDQETSSTDNPERIREVMQEARLVARNLRENDLNQGNVDKVEHAMEVELGVIKADKGNRVKDRSSSGEMSQENDLEDVYNISPDNVNVKTKKHRDEGDLVGQSSKKAKKTHDIVVPQDSLQTSKDDVGIDPFFLEEGAEESSSTSKPPQVKVAIGELHRQRNVKVTKRAVVENDGTLSKQEMRLLNWKLKVREKSKWTPNSA